MDEAQTKSDTLCRFCYGPVHISASKCPHCHEQLSRRSRVELVVKKTVAFVGVATAILSLFYGLKEGYFSIEKRQQQRDMFAAHMSAAERFISLDNLEYAESSLKEALALSPNDQSLRLRYFLLRSENILRELDYYGARLPDSYLESIPELIRSGFSLMHRSFPREEQAVLQGSLARLLQYDRQWQTPGAIDELFEGALALEPDSDWIAYWYGERLVHQNRDKPRGGKLIQQAVALAPEKSLYRFGLGRQQREAGDYSAALASFRKAVALKDQQQDLQGIRAANMAAGELRRTLRDADGATGISGTDFYGLSLQQRMDYVDFILQQAGADRHFKIVAAKLFHTTGRYTEAEDLLRSVLGRYNERSNAEQLDLFAQVLDAQGKEESHAVRRLLANIQQSARYEEILESGLEGSQHRYKIGLRVSKENAGQGIEVIKAFAGYPFAKAGVRQGDYLLEFAHRKIRSLRSIWVPITNFSPGTDVPLKIRRGKQVLDVSVIIE